MSHPYSSEIYANAFEGIAQSLWLPAMGGHVLTRDIPDTQYRDAMGCYPLCVIKEDADFDQTFEHLSDQGLISLVLVADPIFCPTLSSLNNSFDQVKEFKTSYLHDFSRPFSYGRNHRINVGKAKKNCVVKPINYQENLSIWLQLYAHLVATQSIKGIQRFSDTYFERLASLPGLHTHAVFNHDEIIAINLWIEYQGIVYCHLTASSNKGRKLRAGYALLDFAIDYFADRKLLCLGGGAGLVNNALDGLATFKQGFSNQTTISQLCFKIFDNTTYKDLSRHAHSKGFFPAYRSYLADQG